MIEGSGDQPEPSFFALNQVVTDELLWGKKG
jgi:hypothetical protein